jgi:hypothetical protein
LPYARSPCTHCDTERENASRWSTCVSWLEQFLSYPVSAAWQLLK